MLAVTAGVVPARPRSTPLLLVASPRRRSQLLLGAVLVVVATIALPQAAPISWSTALLVVAVSLATWLVSLVAALWNVVGKVGLPVLALEVMWLVETTGGPDDSPYGVFYPALLMYAAAFHRTGRLIATGVVTTLVAATHYVWPFHAQVGSRGTEILVWMAVWGVAAVALHVMAHQVKARARELREHRQRFQSLFEENAQAVFELDRTGQLVSVNKAGCRLLNRPLSAILGRDVCSLLDRSGSVELRRHFADALGRQSQVFQTRVTGQDGQTHWLRVSLAPVVVDEEAVGAYAMVEDITELKSLHQELAQLALHDSPTGSANRTVLLDRIQEAADESRRTCEAVSLLMLDLDGFKQVNDTLGHGAGDQLLVEVAARLR